MKKENAFVLLAVVCGALCIFASCTRSDNPVEQRAYATERLLKKQQRIKVAVAGPWAQKVNDLMSGLELALSSKI